MPLSQFLDANKYCRHATLAVHTLGDTADPCGDRCDVCISSATLAADTSDRSLADSEEVDITETAKRVLETVASATKGAEKEYIACKGVNCQSSC